MALTQSNLVLSPTGKSDALYNRINPPVLQPLGTGLAMGNMQTTTPRTTALSSTVAPNPNQSQIDAIVQRTVNLGKQFPPPTSQVATSGNTNTGGTPSYTSPYNSGSVGTSGVTTPNPVNQPPNAGLYGQIVNNLSNVGTNKAIGNVKDITDLQNQYTDMLAGLRSKGLDIGYGTGAEQILRDAYNSRLSTAQTGLANTLKIGDQQISALSNAGSLAKPEVGSYGQAQYSPLGGTVGGSTEIAPSDPFYSTMQTYAEALANNQGSAIPTNISGNPVLQAQVIKMAKQINPNFNYNVAQGVGSAQQSNAQLGGTVVPSTGAATYGPAWNTYQQLLQSTQNVDQFGQLLTQTMVDGGINPTDIKFANSTLSQIRDQLSSKQQAIYDNTLATLRGKVSGLLSVGGDQVPSQVTADANKILDGSLPLSALSGVLGRISQEGNILLSNQANIVNTSLNQAQGGNIGGSGGNPGTTNTPW